MSEEVVGSKKPLPSMSDKPKKTSFRRASSIVQEEEEEPQEPTGPAVIDYLWDLLLKLVIGLAIASGIWVLLKGACWGWNKMFPRLPEAVEVVDQASVYNAVLKNAAKAK